jgi:hypothetical protein
MDAIRSLSDFADGRRLLSVEAVPIPAPAHAQFPGDHLFVNCLYHQDVGTERCEALLVAARHDTLLLIQTLLDKADLWEFKSICITFYVDIRPRRRSYRFSVLTSYLRDNVLTPDDLLCWNESLLQSSQIDEIARLLPAASSVRGGV